MVSLSAASSSYGNLLEMQVLRSHCKLTESETLEVGPLVISVFTPLPDNSAAGLNSGITDLMDVKAPRMLAYTSLLVSEVQVRYQGGPVSEVVFLWLTNC